MTSIQTAPQEILKTHVSKTISLSDQEFNYFYSHFKPILFKKGEMLIGEGEDVDREYFVLEGCLKTYFVNEDLKMFILQFALSTWWASDYGALYGGQKATFSVDSVIDTQVLCLASEDRERLCKEIHQLEYFFRWRSNRGYVAQQKRLLSFMNNDTKARYEELLNMYPQLYNIVPKQLIAAYLGVSRETLSRLNP
ncbi:Crp/Fnr family transcriptional regulator [Desertivirga xinjiangensis]|uniref:Crp/Fnr family transcriptional regulator n=1 Tax=Desertivirga xinjiangensis TaxID=539206 RepID=UPI00210EDF43|nr:Crp/Fnr family transcriptional regulator [Pedobacter xinjiangensis]